MNAVILVGGFGTRLRPLTCNQPKPLLPVANRPFIAWLLAGLLAQGVQQTTLAVQYLAEQFHAALGEAEQPGLPVLIEQEPEPRGTAGAVRRLLPRLNGPTLVLNGDSLFDLDLQAMLAFHQQRRSSLTIALLQVEQPGAYGFVSLNEQQRVVRFAEKPTAQPAGGGLINAGVYIIEPETLAQVPPNQFAMFEQDLFPAMAAAGEAIYGYHAQGYFTDIGRPATYRAFNHDLLGGKLRFTPPGVEIQPGVWLEGDAQIHANAQISGPVVLGAGCVVAAGAQIRGPVVLGAGCVVAAGATVERAVLWAHCQLAEEVSISDAVLGAGCIIGPRSRISEGATLGDGCIVGADNELRASIRLWPGTTLGDHAIRF